MIRSLLFALVAGVLLSGPGGLLPSTAGAAPDAGSDAHCGPFVLAAARGVPGEIAEPGISGTGRAGADPGSIVQLPAAGRGGATSRAASSEAILALPKNEAGQIPTDFELGPGVAIADSFFSPVVCATLARVEGPPGTPIDRLVTVVPEGSAVVPNDVYASASTEVRPVSALDARGPDPYAPLQYGLAMTGIREARALTSGDGVTIALLDSAPEVAHRDLSGARIEALSAGDLPTEIGVHGTLMAGVIAAIEGNGFGIAGVAPEARLVSIAVCTPDASAGGRCTIYDLLRGLDRAWDAEAQIVNLSLSGPPNILLERGVARLESLGVVVVAAAGNEGTSDRRYPAAYPSVVGVGAIDREGRMFEASNRGPWVELLAPGVDVLSTVPGDAFAFGNGTSLAAAHVSGTLALLTSVVKDPRLARGELFRAMQDGSSAGSGDRPRGAMPRVCDVLRRLEVDCAAGSGR